MEFEIIAKFANKYLIIKKLSTEKKPFVTA